MTNLLFEPKEIGTLQIKNRVVRYFELVRLKVHDLSFLVIPIEYIGNDILHFILSIETIIKRFKNNYRGITLWTHQSLKKWD